MITTIIFDLGEVLLTGLLGIEKYINEMYGLKIENSHWHIKELDDFFNGKISEEEYWDAVVKHHGWQLTVEELKVAVRQNFKEIEGTRAIIKKLKRNGYRLGLLSVHSKEWVEYVEGKYGYRDLFDSVMYSFEVAVSKPDNRAFELILEKLKVKPSECVFVDDKLDNIESARSLGMQAIQFKNSKRLLKDLKLLNIKI